jgi:hypothetical protein
MNSGAQNMKTGHDAPGIAENESGSAKHEKGTRYPPYRRKHVRDRKTCKVDPTPSLPPQMSLGAQSMKTRPDALATAENAYGDAKYENGI